MTSTAELAIGQVAEAAGFAPEVMLLCSDIEEMRNFYEYCSPGRGLGHSRDVK